MCFSAEASFTGAAVLAVIGYGTIKHAPSKEDLLWASIPVFFAIQQLCEGIVWLGLTHHYFDPMITNGAKNLYLFFALGFWPVWIPLAFLVPEKNVARRKLILLTLVLGIGVSYANLAMLPPSELSPTIAGHSIRYLAEAPFPKKLFYLLAVALPSFLSTIRLTWTFGLATLVTCITAEYLYSTTFTSVWCFTAAFMSIFLYMIARNYVKESPLQTKRITIENERKQNIHIKNKSKQ